MAYDPLFESDENKALLAIAAHRIIRGIGIGGIVWGVINLVLGGVALLLSLLNIGLILLALAMLSTGIWAVARPSVKVLLAETVVSILLFVWNLFVSFSNFHLTGEFMPQGLVFPLVIAVIFYNRYKALTNISQEIDAVRPENIKAARQTAKSILKKKLKNEPEILQAHGRKRCRAQLVGDRVFFIQRNLMAAFLAPMHVVEKAIANPNKKRLVLSFAHPLGKLKYSLDRKNSDKLKAWLAESKTPAAEFEAVETLEPVV